MTKIQFWDEDINGSDLLITANVKLNKGTDGNRFEPPEYWWLEIEIINEDEIINLIEYEKLINKIKDMYYEIHE